MWGGIKVTPTLIIYGTAVLFAVTLVAVVWAGEAVIWFIAPEARFIWFPA